MDILYHYCSTATFHEIVRSRTIWLSSLSLSNDSMEGKLVSKGMERLSDKYGLDDTNRRRLLDSTSLVTSMTDGLGFCLSENGDILSQWRGYADDGNGVAIGFSSDYLAKLSDVPTYYFELSKVKYQQDEHDSLLEPIFLQIYNNINSGIYRSYGMRGALRDFEDRKNPEIIQTGAKDIGENNDKLFMDLLPIIRNMFILKSYAFREESEWRLISIVGNDGMEPRSYRAARNCIIPYIEYALTDLEVEPILEVYLGPKNQTPAHNVADFLIKNRFHGVQVRQSESSYR